MVYVAGSNSVLAVGGQGTQGANIVLWDTNSHPRAPPVARISHHSSLVTALQVSIVHMLAALLGKMLGYGLCREALSVALRLTRRGS